jgi:hypothetical protein
MRAMSAGDGPSGPHPSEEALIAYQQGRLDEAQRETMQSHLVECDTCLAAMKNVLDFFEPLRDGESPIATAEISREWQVFTQRMKTEKAAAEFTTEVKPHKGWLNPRLIFAVAASLILGIGLTAAWALRLRQERQQLVAQLQTQQTTWLNQQKQLQEENRRLQEQAGNLQQLLESQQAQLKQMNQVRQPDLNVSVYDVMSREFTQRSGDTREVTRVRMSPISKGFTLVLNGHDQPNYPSYVLKIVNQRGQQMWRSDGLRRDEEGNFCVGLDRSFLPPGKYHLFVFGPKGHLQRIAEYVILIE